MRILGATRRLWVILGLVLCLGLFGCEGDDGDIGPQGPEGSAGEDLTAAPSDVSLEITSASIQSPPVVEFTVTNQGGEGITGLTTSDLRFAVAKLKTPENTGDTSNWQSYINRDEEATDVGPAAPNTTVQATNENDGTLENLGGGDYRYTFSADVENATNPVTNEAIPFEPSLLHRVGIELRSIELANGLILDKNDTFDFVPSGGAAPATRDIAATQSCNDCHTRLAIHGGHRVEVEYCVMCHNQGSVDANSGNTVDMKVMIHKIHMGENLPSVELGPDLTASTGDEPGPYTIYGFRDSPHNYNTVVWPGFPIGEPLDCADCHFDGEVATKPLDKVDTVVTENGERWRTTPTAEACGSCHDDVNFVTGANHGGGATVNADGEITNANCATCHPATGAIDAASDVYPVPAVHDIELLSAADEFEYNIVGTNYNSVSGELTVDFEVLRNGIAMNIMTDPEWTDGTGASRLAIDVGWPTEDYTNEGSGASISQFQPGQTTDFLEPGQPVSINALTKATDADGDLIYTATTTLPAEAQSLGSGVVAMEGHPAVTIDGVVEEAPVDGVVDYFGITDTTAKPRRDIVSIEKCNQCHGTLSLHGNNRTDNIELCVICHNPNATDIMVRPATLDVDPQDNIFDNFMATGEDGKREEPIDFKRMIHAIHAGEASEHGFREEGIAVYGFGRFSVHDYSHVRYPVMVEVADGDALGTSQCLMCHMEDTFTLPLAGGVLGTTVQTTYNATVDGGILQTTDAASQTAAEESLADPSDDLNITPISSACYSCHDSDAARGHMMSNGGSFEAFQSEDVFEGCSVCHGPGRSEDVAEVHPGLLQDQL